jgi:recombination protein RecT
MTGQTVATTKPRTIFALIKEQQGEIARALPKHMSADRVARLAMTALRKTPKLQSCEPLSFLGSVMTAAALGLEPEVNGEAYLVPYGRECQLIIGYQGWCKLYWQHPLAKRLEAEAVHARDFFEWQKGTGAYIHYRPALADRGEVVAYYGLAELTTGASIFEVLAPAQVQALRGGKVGPKGDIADPMRWMERKTALKQALKLLPKSVQLVNATIVDERFPTMATAQQITDAEVVSEADLPEPVEGVVQ